MQATNKYWKSIDRWVVSTRADGIKKLRDSDGKTKKGGIKTFKTQEAAEDYAAFLNAAQETGGVVCDATAGTIAAAVAPLNDKTDIRVNSGVITYRSGRNIKTNIKTWLDLELAGKPLGEYTCKDVSTADIEDRLIPQIKRSPKTIKEKLDALKQLFDVAHKQGWCSHVNPARLVKLETVRYARGKATKKRVARFNVSEIRKVIELGGATVASGPADSASLVCTIDWYDGLALSFAAQTGLRFSEQAPLLWSDLQLDDNRVTVSKAVRAVGKGVHEVQDAGKTAAAYRTVFLTPQIVQQLKAWKLRSPCSGDDDLVFITRARTMNVSADNWRNRVLRSACVDAGIDPLRWHDLRHFFASLCLELFGADFHRITTLMGHKSISTTRELYGHWVDDQKRDETDAAAFGKKLWG